MESGDSNLCGIPKRKSFAVLAGRIKQGRSEMYTGCNPVPLTCLRFDVPARPREGSIENGDYFF